MRLLVPTFVVAAICIAGCTKEIEERQTKLEERIDELEKKLAEQDVKDSSRAEELSKQLEQIGGTVESLEEKLARSAQRASRPPRAPRARRPRPDANSVYSVAVGTSPFVGREDARVTIVKAFEFA